MRTAPDPIAAWGEWRVVRDELFGDHPQSPLPSDARAGFSGLDYCEYRSDARVLTELRPASPTRVQIAASAGCSVLFDRVATAAFSLGGDDLELEVYWLSGYGGESLFPSGTGPAAPRPTAPVATSGIP